MGLDARPSCKMLLKNNFNCPDRMRFTALTASPHGMRGVFRLEKDRETLTVESSFNVEEEPIASPGSELFNRRYL